MAAQNDNVGQGYSEDWHCFVCFKTVSAERPPILNLDNCSCSEAGTSLNDPGALNLRFRNIPNEANGIHPMDPSSVLRSKANTASLTHCPSSTSGLSSDNEESLSDILATKPPHKALLSLPMANPPIPTSVSDGEHRNRPHRRARSLHEIKTHIHANAEMPYSLRRYISAMSPLERSYHGGARGACQGDEDQALYKHDIYLIGPGTASIHAVKGIGGSVESSAHSSIGLMSWGRVDPVAGSGGWMEEVEGCAMEWPHVIDDSALLDE
jgi:hypothetical protein